MTETAERVEKIDESTQADMNRNQLCFLLTKQLRQCLRNPRLKDLTGKVSNMYSSHPGFFIISLMMAASVVLPVIIVMSIISIHIVIGVLVFIIFQAAIILSSAAILSFIFLIVIASLIMTAISIITVYLSAHWFLGKLKNMKKNFIYNFLQY